MAEVWIVDDEPDIIDLLKYNLHKAGYSVKTFPDADPALAALNENQPDIILCDWMMPGMDGLSFCRKIRTDLNPQRSSLRFVMVSCKSDRESVTRARAEGVDDYVVKPFRMPDLIRRIETLRA